MGLLKDLSKLGDTLELFKILHRIYIDGYESDLNNLLSRHLSNLNAIPR